MCGSWEYSENICEKWLRVTSWMNWYSITTRRIRTTMWKRKIVQVDRKLNETDANDDGDDDTTPHFTACVALHIEHTHEYIHWERASWARTVLFLVCTSSILTLAQVRALSALHSRPSSWPSMWLLSLRLDFLLLPLRLPPVCLPLHLLPPQRRAAAGAQQEDHGKSVRLRYQRGWGHLRRPPPPHRLWAQRPWLQRAPELIGPLLLQDPCRGPGRGWPDTRQDAHWSIPRTSRLLRTRRRVSQSVVVVCTVR